jgi:CheY-like chemotaxis protein
MRPAIMVVEGEPFQALSARKLVLETAKFNVLTAHSTREALECLEAFPKISAAVIVEDSTVACDEIVQTIKRELSDIPVIALSAREGFSCRGADHYLSSYTPEALVNLLRVLLGDPQDEDARKNKARF